MSLAYRKTKRLTAVLTLYTTKDVQMLIFTYCIDLGRRDITHTYRYYVKLISMAKFANSADYALILDRYTTVETSNIKGFKFYFLYSRKHLFA